MKKYWTVFLTIFSNFSALRMEIVLNLIQSFVVPAFMLLALSQTNPLGMSVSTMIPYYLLISITLPLFKSEIDQQMGNLSHSGDISTFLVRPIKLRRYFLASEISRKAATLLVIMPLLVITLWFFKFQVGLLTVFTMMISFLVSFHLNYLLGLFTFWFDEFWVLQNLNSVSMILLGGVALPYVLFPDWAVKLIYLTPFPYIASLPTRVIQQSVSMGEFSAAILWIVLLYFLTSFIETKAINKYSYVAS